MRRTSALVFLSVLAIGTLVLLAGSREQPVTVQDWIDQTNKRLQDVWQRNVRPSIDLVPEFRGKAEDLELAEPRRRDQRVNCPVSPRLRLGRTPPVIEYSREILFYSFYLEQATLFYLLDLAEVDRPDVFNSYVTDVMFGQSREAIRRCVTSRPTERQPYPDQFPSIAGHNGLEVSEYQQVLARAAERIDVADYVAAFPIFFVLLHEAGHYLLGHTRSPNLETELEADRAAVRIFHANRVPATLGIGHFIIFSHADPEAPDRGGISSDFACRIEAVALADTKIGFEPSDLMPELGDQVIRRVERLRDHYIRTYGEICGR
ncbi:MAG: hypothetical protein ACFB6S_20120 [Geminicoccaceae bacterium]